VITTSSSNTVKHSNVSTKRKMAKQQPNLKALIEAIESESALLFNDLVDGGCNEAIVTVVRARLRGHDENWTRTWTGEQIVEYVREANRTRREREREAVVQEERDRRAPETVDQEERDRKVPEAVEQHDQNSLAGSSLTGSLPSGSPTQPSQQEDTKPHAVGWNGDIPAAPDAEPIPQDGVGNAQALALPQEDAPIAQANEEPMDFEPLESHSPDHNAGSGSIGTFSMTDPSAGLMSMANFAWTDRSVGGGSSGTAVTEPSTRSGDP
jgi:hypothetical protein